MNDPAGYTPDGAMPPLPEYEEGSLQARKADIMDRLSREMAGEGNDAYADDDRVKDAFYLDDIIAPEPETWAEEEKEGAIPPAEGSKERKKGLSEWIVSHKVVSYVFAFAILAAVVGGLAIWLAGRNTEVQKAGTAVSLNTVASGNTASDQETLISEEPLILNEDDELNSLINRYFTARENNDIDTYSSLRSYTDSLEQAKLEAKSEYIESYRDIKCYTKKGPYEDSYIVYVSYYLKLKEWDQTVPALETLVVCREESVSEDSLGKLYVYSGAFEENVVDYIQKVTAQDDVVDLFKHVDSEYQEIMDANPEYEEYMSSLKQLIRDGVGIRLAAAADVDDKTDQGKEEPEGSGDAEGENSVSENETGTEEGGITDEPESISANETPAQTSNETFEVEAITYVNVRASDSEKADKVGSVNPGTRLTCKEQLANGWSHVIYDGKDAYIKSDYLTVVGQGLQVVGKAEVTSTVNIRAKADIGSEWLGVAYAGTTYDCVEKDNNGWTGIIFNGKLAYIKSEYLKIQ